MTSSKCTLKVGDMVKWWDYVPGDNFKGMGIIVELSRTGSNTFSALVLFETGELAWTNTQALEIVGESR